MNFAIVGFRLICLFMLLVATTCKLKDSNASKTYLIMLLFFIRLGVFLFLPRCHNHHILCGIVLQNQED